MIKKLLSGSVLTLFLMSSVAYAGDATNEAAFRSVLENNLPLSPKQIEQLHKLYDITQQAANSTPNAPPTPVSSSLVVRLGPGEPSPVIRLAAGFVSSLVFIDSTGAPWPIAAYGLGNPDSFNIQWDQSSNTMFIQATKAYSHGNMAIRLDGLDTPVMISLVSGQKDVDYRADLQVLGRGPNAIAPLLMHDSMHDSTSLLVNILDNIPPEGSTKLIVNQAHGDVWMSGARMYFRTKLTLLSPAWQSTVSSPDGTRVYELAPTPLMLATESGRTISIRVEGM